MSLFRLTYLRAGAQRRITFAARDLVAAAEWAERWSRLAAVQIEHIVPTRNRWARRGGSVRRIK